MQIDAKKRCPTINTPGASEEAPHRRGAGLQTCWIRSHLIIRPTVESTSSPPFWIQPLANTRESVREAARLTRKTGLRLDQALGAGA